MPSCRPQSGSGQIFSVFEQYASLRFHRQPFYKCNTTTSVTRVCNQLSPRRHIITSPISQKESPRRQTHYTLFPATLPSGPPPTGPFTIDLTHLKREFLQLQSRAHPDLHYGDSKSRAEGLSALINEAYKTLQHPLLRAQYILALRGIEIADDESSQKGDGSVDEELLMEVLEVREAIEEAETEEAIKRLDKENAERIGGCVERLEGFFGMDDLEGARREVGRLRYWCSIEDALRGWERGKKVVLEH